MRKKKIFGKIRLTYFCLKISLTCLFFLFFFVFFCATFLHFNDRKMLENQVNISKPLLKLINLIFPIIFSFC